MKQNVYSILLTDLVEPCTLVWQETENIAEVSYTYVFVCSRMYYVKKVMTSFKVGG